MSKHTPGPWELVSLSGYGSPFSIRMPYLSESKDVPPTHYGVQSVRRREDARLIVAAPELLEALQECEEYFDNRADADHDETGFVPNEEMKLLTTVRAALAKAGAA